MIDLVNGGDSGDNGDDTNGCSSKNKIVIPMKHNKRNEELDEDEKGDDNENKFKTIVIYRVTYSKESVDGGMMKTQEAFSLIPYECVK